MRLVKDRDFTSQFLSKTRAHTGSPVDVLFFLNELFKFLQCRSGGIGRHTVLRGQGPKGRAGSSPAFGTLSDCQVAGSAIDEGKGIEEGIKLQTSKRFTRFQG